MECFQHYTFIKSSYQAICCGKTVIVNAKGVQKKIKNYEISAFMQPKDIKLL